METKYNLKELLWFLNGSKVVQAGVTYIEAFLDGEEESCTYSVRSGYRWMRSFNGNIKVLYSFEGIGINSNRYSQIPEEMVFKTKEELIASL